MVKLRKIFTMLGVFALATGIYLNSPFINRNYPLIEKSISKSENLPESIKNHKPKRILYLISDDFKSKIDLDTINENLKSKLDYMKETYSQWGNRIRCKNSDMWTYDRKVPPKENVERLEQRIKDFRLDEKHFMMHLADLNLFKENDEPYLIRKNIKDCEVILHDFKNQKEFLNHLSDESIRDVDEIIIYSHGHKGFISPDMPVEFFEFPKFFDPRKYITVKDVLKLSPEKLKAIRSKFTKGAVCYLQSCETLKDCEKRTTIAEALTYLFQMPVVTSKTMVNGWAVDVNPYDSEKFILSDPETLVPENMAYTFNYSCGDWVVVCPKGS